MYDTEHYSKIIKQPAEKVAEAIDSTVMHMIIEHSSLRDVLGAIKNGGYEREVFYGDFMVSCQKQDESNASFLVTVLRGNNEKNAKNFVNELESRLN